MLTRILGVRRRTRLLLAGGVVAAVFGFRLLGGGTGSAPEEAEGTEADAAPGLGPCPAGEGPPGALCQTVEVPEDRAQPEGRTSDPRQGWDGSAHPNRRRAV